MTPATALTEYQRLLAADIDDVAVRRAVQGTPVRLTRAERVEAARRLTNAGANQNTVAERLRLNSSCARALLRRLEVAS